MGGDRHNYDGARWILSQNRKTNFGGDSKEGLRQVMVVGLSGRGVICYSYLAYKGVW